MITKTSFVAAPPSHANCMVCGLRNDPLGTLAFTRIDEARVSTTLFASAAMEGYRGLVHGGMIATLLDAAMTHCLFAQGIEAYTADMHVRYVVPVHLHARLELTACLVEACGTSLFRLEADLRVEGRVHARAKARFVTRPEPGEGP